ncbi:MAG: hypothetical protein HYZ39_16425 [Mycolicibacterium cosmeticum]|nr:hypothetical protein [Mycolicibacterium cosmeticum]
MTTIGYATLQLIPSLRGVKQAIERQARDLKITADVDVTGAREAGLRAGRGIRRGIDDAQIASGLHRQVESELSSANASRTGNRFGTNLGGAIAAGVTSSVRRLAGGLALVSRMAGNTARDIGRITSALILLTAVGRGLSVLNNIGKITALGTIGFSALLGVATGVSALLGGPMVAALTAFGAAMGVAAGAATGLLGPAIAALGIGMAGLKDAAKAYMTTSEGGAASAKSSAAAARQIEQAEKGVERAKRDSRDAERDLTRARKDAAEQIEDLNLALRGSALSERDAQLSLLEARRDLQNIGKDGQPVDMLDRERAVLRVQEAEQRLAETQESNGDLAEKAADANRLGVEGADGVVSAKQRVADANQAIIDSERQLADARQAAADAQGGGASVDPFDAMIGQRMAPLLDAVKNVRRSVTDSLSSALTPAFATFGGLLDNVSPKLSGIAGVLGGIGTGIATSLAGPVATKGFDDMAAASTEFFTAFKGEQGIGGLASSLVSFAGTAAKTFAGVGVDLNGALLSFGDWLRNISPGEMVATFQAFRQVLSSIGNVVRPIVSGLRELGGITAPALAPGFQDIGTAIGQATPGITEMARTLMPGLSQVMSNLAPVLPALVSAFTPWATVTAALAPHLATIVTHLGPLAPIILAVTLAAKGIGAAMIVWNTAMAAASIAQGVFAAATGAGTAALGTNTIALAAHRVAMVAGATATKAITAGQWLLNAALTANPIGLVVAALAALVAGLVYAYNHSETFRKIVDAAWKGIKVAAEAVVNWFVDTAWPFLKKVWEGIGEGFSWLVTKAGEVWTGVKEKFTAIVDFVTGLPQAITNGAKGMWEGLKNGLLEVLRWIADKWNSLSDTLSFDVPEWVPEIGGKKFQPMPKIPQFDVGGYTGNVPINQIAGVVHGDEFVVKAASRQMIEAGHPGLLDHMNTTGRLPGYQLGGFVDKAKQFARGLAGSPYLMGGFSANGIDCSGLVSAVVNVATGREPYQSRMSTVTEGSWLQALGFKTGTGESGDLRAGWWDKGGGANGHTAGTFPDGTNFESNGSQGVVIGGSTGASHPQFTEHAYLPVGTSSLSDNGTATAPSTGVSTKGDAPADLGPLPSGGGSYGGGAGSLPTSLSGLSSWGLDGLGVDTPTPSGTRRFEFGKAASAAVSGQVGSLLGVFGVNDSPGWLQGLSKFAGGLSIGGSLGGVSAGVPHAGTGAAPGPLDDELNKQLYDDGGWLPEGLTLAHNKTGGPEAVLTKSAWGAARDGIDIAMKMAKGFMNPGAGQQAQQPVPAQVNYEIHARDTEDAFIRAQRQERERAAAKLARF